MNRHPNTEMQEIMEDMINGPPIIYTCIVNYEDGSSRAYTFSIEDNLALFIQNLEEVGSGHKVISYVFYESLLDVEYDHDYTHYTTWH